MATVVESGKIIALSVLAAVVYGVVHDQITARVCLEYFTIGHPDVAGHEPTLVAIYWGVVATWWVGLPLGVALAIAARAGDRAKADVRQLAPRLGLLLVALLGVALLAGTFGWARLALGLTQLGPYFDRISPDQRAGFVFDRWAHEASYAGGVLGGLGLCVATYARRAPPAGEEVGARSRLFAGLGVAAIVLSPILYAAAGLLVLGYEGGWGGRFATPYSIDDMGPVLFVLGFGSPWIEIALALLGLIAVGQHARRVASSAPAT